MSAQGTVYVVRHAETEWTLTGRHTGRTDIPLTAHGEDEARELAGLLSPVRFAHVLTSPRRRAMQTCALALPEPAAEIEADLEEWDYGGYEGRRTTEIRRERADWDIFRDGCPQGESPAQVSRRADRLIARVRSLNGDVALFSHGQFACVLVARWIGLALTEARHFSLETASFGVLGHDPHHPEVPVIVGWNLASRTIFPDAPYPSSRNRRIMKQRAIERRENERGEVLFRGNPEPLQENEQ